MYRQPGGNVSVSACTGIGVWAVRLGWLGFTLPAGVCILVYVHVSYSVFKIHSREYVPMPVHDEMISCVWCYP